MCPRSFGSTHLHRHLVVILAAGSLGILGAAAAFRVEEGPPPPDKKIKVLLGNLLQPGPALRPEAAPANDQCAGAEVIPASGPFPHLTAVTADITDATTVGDPPAPTCGFANTPPVLRSIWYKFTPTTTATYTISACADAPTGSTVNDTVIGIYTSSTATCGGTYTQTACDDDSCASEALQSVASQVMSAGTTYFIVVNQWGGEPPPTVGNTAIQLRITQALAPSNDTCAGATPLTLNIPANGTNALATNDYQLTGIAGGCYSGIGNTTSSAVGRDTVWSYTPSVNGSYSFRVALRSATGGGNLVLYTQTTCPAAPPTQTITCNGTFTAANRTASTAQFAGAEEIMCVTLTGGTTYYLFVDESTATATGGDYLVEVNPCTRELEPNDTPATANTYACGIEGTRSPAANLDFFSLGTPGSGSRVFAMADGIASSNNDYRLRVTDTTNTLEFDDDDNTTPWGSLAPNISGCALLGAPAYLEMDHFSATVTTEPYRLYSVTQPGGAGLGGSSATAETEPNNGASLLQVNMAANNFFSGSVPANGTELDVFAFAANAGDLIVAQIDGDPLRDNTPINAAISLFDSSGAQLLGFNDSNGTSVPTPNPGVGLLATTPSSPGEVVTWRARYSGTYYAAISNQGTTAGDYLYSISINCLRGDQLSADLSATKAGPATASANSDVTYTITITDNGPNAASGVSFTDTLPPNTTVVSLTGPAGWTCTPGGGGFTCTNQALGSGIPQMFSLVVHVPQCFGNGPATNSVTVSSLTIDPAPANNSASTLTAVTDPGTCDDGSACTPGDACVGTVCQGGPPPSCDDGNACTSNDCDPGTGQCVYPPIVCNDNNACTDDSCNPATGCIHAPDDTNGCADADLCTSDVCSSGTCSHTPTTCDDGNPCTDDACNPATGCVFTPDNTNTCTDGHGCTADVCRNGTCVSSASTFTGGSVTFLDNGPSSPYPATIFVPSVCGTVTNVQVTLSGLTHTFPDDLDVLLVGPTGVDAILMSDVGGSTDASGLTLTLDDTGPALPDAGPLVSGTFKPTNVEPGDPFPSPAPTPSGATALAGFNGLDPVGTWKLYVLDDSGQDTGTLGGWSLTFTLDCNDDDPCTLDTFDPSVGCVYTATSCQPPLEGPACTTCKDAPTSIPCATGCGDNPCGGTGSAGDPLYLFSGEFYESAVDLRIPGRGLDFVWSRKYRSRIGPDTELGNGWDYSYNIRLALLGSRPDEVQNLRFSDEQTLTWAPLAAADPIRYCTLRSTNPHDFVSVGTMSFVETDGADTMSTDADTPSVGHPFFYLVSAKNDTADGSLGTDSAGRPRQGRPCGTSLSRVLLLDGHGRRDVYRPQPDGTGTASEFFRVLTRNPDGSHTLTFPDTGTWNFHAFDHSAQEGKIQSITDRNGNRLSFFYDSGGRLTTVRDTLDRDIAIVYNPLGRIASVTDFAGRQVKYEYYSDSDPGGSSGDLKSVTTPAVVGTPNGNDFPTGKTTGYTYSKGFADTRVNHNLLTITDPKGQTYLCNIYSREQNPSVINFDRVAQQIWGNQGGVDCGVMNAPPSVELFYPYPTPGDVVSYTYISQAPTSANNFAVQKTIVNDRAGNVKEYFFDSKNRDVLMREFTGRAVPGTPTTNSTNRPVGPLHPTDPAYFETRWEYNADSLAVRTLYPNLNEELFTYDAGNASRRSQGNLVMKRRLPGPLGGGDQPLEIRQTFAYDTGFGGCCGTNFVTSEVDARGNETTHTYDSHGNRIHTQHRIPSIVEDFEYNNTFGQMTAHILPDNGSGHRRRDEFTYYATGSQRGYLHEQIVDAGGLALTTTYEHDLVGNVVRTVDPLGHDALRVVNQLDQVVREISPEVTDGSGVRYQRDTFYDADDNVVRLDVQNVDDQGTLQPNAYFTTVMEYEILNNPTRICQEAGTYTGPIPGPTNRPTCLGLPDEVFVTTGYEYDANRNRQLVRLGQATSGADPFNVVATLHDERDLPFRQIRAPGSSVQSTTQDDYDSNRNLVRTSQGTESSPRVTTHAHDGYDRRISTTDPMGNVISRRHDANGNVVSERTDGELIDVPESSGNVRLSETTYTYDAMDRRIRTDVAFFDTQTQAPIGDGIARTTYDYTDTSAIKDVTDDNGHRTTTTFDPVNRRQVVTDAKNNTTTYTYDANSNVTAVTTVEKSDLGPPGHPDETFVTAMGYDNLDRLIQVVDNAGNTNLVGYDSRANRVLSTDANGNATRYRYDGLNRLLETSRDMDGNDVFTDPVDIVTTQSWDDSSRLATQTDDNGSVTRYAYDALDRSIVTQMADGTLDQVGSGATWALGELEPNLGGFSAGYDVHDNATSTTDANESVVTSSYDLLNRLASRSIAPGPGVSSDTTAESYQYDGLSRLVRAQDDDSVVASRYDSRSNITQETQTLGVNPPRTITSVHDGVGNELSCTYPGGRMVTAIYDELERKKTVTDTTGAPQPIATYDYIGPQRVTRREYGNGTRTSYSYDGVLPNQPGDFGVKRIVHTTHTKIVGGAVLDERAFTWDRMDNKTKREDVRPGGTAVRHDYAYDSVYRLTHSVKTPPGGPGGTIDYSLDGVGNRTFVTGGPNPGPYTLDPTLPEPADREVNQYTTTPPDGRAYDENGNLIAVDVVPAGPPTLRTITYDYRNQMVQHIDAATGIATTYAYDAVGRRIRKVVDVTAVAGGPTETRFLLDGWREIEEQDAAGATQATYVFGLYVDDVLTMRRVGTDYYYHTDDLYNVMAITDATGAVVERYEYQDYGSPQFLDAVGNPTATQQSAIRNPLLFTGRRYDAESGAYYYRARYLDPQEGRFITRDPIGTWTDAVNMGNGYSYVGNRPFDRLDPRGLLEGGGLGGGIRGGRVLVDKERNLLSTLFDWDKAESADIFETYTVTYTDLGCCADPPAGKGRACLVEMEMTVIAVEKEASSTDPKLKPLLDTLDTLPKGPVAVKAAALATVVDALKSKYAERSRVVSSQIYAQVFDGCCVQVDPNKVRDSMSLWFEGERGKWAGEHSARADAYENLYSWRGSYKILQSIVLWSNP